MPKLLCYVDECLTIVKMSQLIASEDYGSSSVKNHYILTADGEVQLSSAAVKQWRSVSQFFRVSHFVSCVDG